MKLNLRGRTVSLERAVVMGILNVTPDSFSDGGRFLQAEHAVKRAGEMIRQGAGIIDIGGESTRPGSDPVDEKTELQRVMPVVEALIKRYPDLILSVDTTKFEVAKAALEAGAHLINDVSGLRKEPRFAELCAEYGAGYVLMHSVRDPKTMQINPEYNDVITDIESFFREGLNSLEQAGVESVILDPGIGFGKRLEHNLEIIRHLDSFRSLKRPLLVGASRKRMIGDLLNDRAAEGRLAGTLAVHYHSLLKGAKILRVHDVEEASDIISVCHAISGTPAPKE